jgi:hypothetical protein
LTVKTSLSTPPFTKNIIVEAVVETVSTEAVVDAVETTAE